MTSLIERTRTPAPTSPLDLTVRQLDAIAAFHEVRRGVERLARTDEAWIDGVVRLAVLSREHAALVARVSEHLQASGNPLRCRSQARAIVVHRRDAFVDAIGRLLAESGVDVVLRTDNGADAVGAAIAEQPDLVLVEENPAILSGEEVIREIRRFAPTAVLASQVSTGDRVGALLDAGASLVFSRRVTSARVVADALTLLRR